MDAGAPATPVDAGVPSAYSPVGVSSAIGKVKTLLTGEGPTDDEIAAVTRDPSALSGLVAGWMATPQYQERMLGFFATAFQQDEITWEELIPQYGQFPIPPFPDYVGPITENLSESYARTVMELIAEGQPFTATMTTTRFMMTPALMAAYAVLDGAPLADFGTVAGAVQAIPHAVTLESSTPVPIEDAVDPANPNYLVFYDPAITNLTTPGCPTSTITYPAPVLVTDLAGFLLNNGGPSFDYTNGVVSNVSGSMARCIPPELTPEQAYLQSSDFSTWQMITVRQPAAGESTTPFYDLPSFRAGYDLVLNTPRVGFFSTVSFFGQWQTNQSNLARVTANQTLIVGLGQPVDLTNTTVPPSLAALDQTHAAPGTDCYGCHQSLDPMRQFFRQAYTLTYSQQQDPSETAQQGSFGFHGVSAPGTSIFDLGSLLASHPMFASAWVQKLCTWANSAPCDTSDPEFKRLVSVFTSSNFSWNALVQALFSSPIVTNLTDTKNADGNGEVFPIARRAELCALLSNRLGLVDACGLAASTTPAQDLQVVQTIASSWPSDSYARGSATAVLANAPSLFTRAGLENVCVALADHLVDNPQTGQFSSAQPDAALQSLATHLMGLGSDRSAAAVSILQRHFQNAQAANASATDALKSTFALACESPWVAGIGL